MKEYYKIGEISRLYGIGTDSLRYYEEIGILKPRRDDNGYRMYGINDIQTLNVLRELRSIGFSMQEIKAHLQDFNLQKTLALFSQGISAIDAKIDELLDLKAQLLSRTAEIKSHLQQDFVFDEPVLRHIGPRHILKLSEEVYRDEYLDLVIKELQKKSQNQLYLIGNGNTGAILPLTPISQGEYGYFNGVFCTVDEGEEFDAVIEEGDYLCSTVKGSYAAMGDAWKKLFSQLSRRNLTAAGDPMEFYIIDNHDTRDESEYITQLQIPVLLPEES